MLAMAMLPGHPPPTSKRPLWKERTHEVPARLLPFCILCSITISAAVHARDAQEQPGAQTMPTVVSEVKPDYTSEAKQQGIQGIVELSVVVNDDGTVGEVKVTKSWTTSTASTSRP